MLGWDKKSNSDLDSGLELGDLDDTLGPREDFSNNSSNDPFSSDNKGFENKPSSFQQGSNDPFSTAPQNYKNDNQEDFRYGNNQQQNNMQAGGFDGKDLQIVIEKLDTIKSSVASLHHRLDKLEQQKSNKRW